MVFLKFLPHDVVLVTGGHSHLGKGHGAKHCQGHPGPEHSLSAEGTSPTATGVSAEFRLDKLDQHQPGPGAWHCVPISSPPAGSVPRAASRAASTGPCVESAGPQGTRERACSQEHEWVARSASRGCCPSARVPLAASAAPWAVTCARDVLTRRLTKRKAPSASTFLKSCKMLSKMQRASGSSR